MKISELKIKNVKSFREEVNIKFDDHFNILIGSNGGGKSNLLDIITIVIRHYFLKGYNVQKEQNNGIYETYINSQNHFGSIETFLEKFIGNNSETAISITFKVTKRDLDNLVQIKSNIRNLNIVLNTYKNKPVSDFNFCESWDLEQLVINSSVNYEIKNYRLDTHKMSPNEKIIFEYLNYIELLLILMPQVTKLDLKPVFLYFSPNRSTNQYSLHSELSTENYYDLLHSYVGSTSKQTTSLIKLATNYFARKRREFESNPDTGHRTLWMEDEEVALVTSYLKRLNYEWDLKLEDDHKNIFSIRLSRNGQEFLIQQASSGEKEILNFLLGIFAFNIKNGTIIIDEPEIHLHPKWQNELVELFFNLSMTSNTDNQFIISTHSPIFINSKTVAKTIRIFKNSENSSTAVTVNDDDIGSTKDLLHIVNTHNNQKIFFADKVILVEGIHDRIIFERLFRFLTQGTSDVIEVIEVQSKNNLLKYRKFLEVFKIPNFIIADRDYLLQEGTEKVKKLFITDFKQIDKKVFNSKKSEDRKALSSELEYALSTHDLEHLENIWTHIKSRIITIKSTLDESERECILECINDLKVEKNILILPGGEIEDYLPAGYKKLDDSIRLVQDDEFKKWIKDDSDQLRYLINTVEYCVRIDRK